jgi:predicted transcriptional regulator of viral defense system
MILVNLTPNPAHKLGLITVHAAFKAGLNERDIQRLVAHKIWTPVRRGAYVETDHWNELDQYRSRPQLIARAAHLMMTESHHLSHDSAALELGIPLLDPPKWVHITRPGVGGSRHRHGVKHHGAVYQDFQETEIEGIPVLDRARTAVDLAREHGFPAGVAACDAVLRAGATRDDLRRALVPMRSWRGVRAAKTAVAFADPRAESLAESLARILVAELGIGPIWPQFPVRLPSGGTRWIDLVVGCHAFEFDGKVKYVDDKMQPLSGDALWEEKKRQLEIARLNMGDSRIIWADFFGARRNQALRRLASEYAATERRFGPVLPAHMLEFADRNRESWRQRL